jgi:proline iminopeptidase
VCFWLCAKVTIISALIWQERKMNRVCRARTGFFWTLTLAVVFALALGARPAAADVSGQTFETPGATIYYEVTGSGAGPPLVLVNGGPGFDHTYLHLSPVWDTLGRNRRIVFYDQRGNGRSVGEHKGQTLTLNDQIEDLEALRAHLGAERIDLLGHSWGGYLVMAYAAIHPDRIAHLITVDSAAPKISETLFLFDDVYPEGSAREAAANFADELGDKRATAINMHEYLMMLFYSPEKRDAFAAAMPDPASAYNKAVNKAVWDDLARYDLNPEIRKFTFPVLVITGRFDMNVAPLVAYKIHQAIAGSKFLVFEHSGHLPFVEEPVAFEHALGDFLNSK